MSFINKRRRDETEEEEPLTRHQRPHFAKRPRQELSQELQLAIKLCEDITKLGEKNLKNYSDDINYMSFPISEEIGQSEEIRNALLKTFYALIIEQPHKLQFLSGLIKICNLRNSIVGKYVFEYLHQKSQELIDGLLVSDEEGEEEEKEDNNKNDNNLNKLKLILRFFAINRGLILNNGVFKIFEQFLKLSIELQGEESTERNGISEAIYYNVLISIPYLQFQKEDDSNITSLLNLANEFKIIKPKSSSMFEHFDDSIVKTARPYDSKFLVDLIKPSLDTLSIDDLPLINVDELIEPLIEDLKTKNEFVMVEHSLPQFSIQLEALKEKCQLKGNIDTLWKNPRIILEVYLSNTHDFETKPSIESYFGILLNDICQDVIQNMEFNKNIVSQQLLILDAFFKPLTFAKPGSSIDKLTILNDKKLGTILEVDMDDPSSAKISKLIQEIDEEFENGYKSTWKIEDILTESILNLIFNLPDVSNPIIYFYTVLVECCSKEAKSMAPVFGRAIRFFFTNITILDFELRSRYLDWLAVQLSNFRFQWKWHEWNEYVLKYDDLKFQPIMIFIKNLIAKEIRLSSVGKIKDTLPEIFHKFLDISLNDDKYIEEYDTQLYGVEYWEQDNLKLKFIDDANPKHELCQKIFEILNGDDTDAKYDDVLTQLIKDLDANDFYIINLIFQSTCIIGSRSISHVKFFIEKNLEFYQAIIANLSTDDDNLKSKWIIESVLRVWNHEPQIGYLILEIFLINKLINGESYLINLFENYAILLNISTIESFLRVLSNLQLYNISNDVFIKIYEITESKLIDTINGLQVSTTDPITIINEDEETNDLKWRYVELLKFLKSILRKFNKYYQKLDLTIGIEHEQTKKIVVEYLEDLKEMT